MSASIDKGPHAADEDSRAVLSAWLDDYIAGRCDRAKMHESFLQVCRSNPEAPWDALALLDQYQRRGRVDVALARSLKAEIAQLVFGVANQTEETRQPEATIDTTGSRWRKLYAERGGPLNSDKAEDEPPPIDATLHRAFVPPASRSTPTPSRDFDPVTPPLTAIQNFDPPMTRPPAMSRPSSRESSLERGTEPTRDAVVGIGTQLRDRYELMEVIGTGRSGTVYRAFDQHRSHLPSPSCYVAVRVLQLPTDHRESALARIEREAYDAQSLSHQNIVSVFDLDRHHDVYFVVMELLEGETLNDIMQRQAGKPLSGDRALAILGAVGAALTHAHQRNIAHGDLKPAGVILTTNGEVKVTDFGFARSHALDQWVGGEPTVDGIGANSTAAYASAERVNGDDPTARDDVYSFACMAYELLSGRHPFGGRSAPLARAHGRSAPKVSGLNARQWAALQNGLSWSREERRIDIAELVSVLGGVDSNVTLPPMPPPLPSAEKNLENPFGGSKGVVLAVLLIAAVGGVAWWQWPRFIQPDSVSPVTTPAQGDIERSTPTASDSAPASSSSAASGPTETVETPKVAPTQNLDTAPKKGGPIVAATVDQPSANASSGARREQNASQDARRESASPQSSAANNGAGKPVSVEFDKDTYVATEGDAMVKLTVHRNGSTRGPAKFRWSLRANSAEAGTDYADLGPGIEEVPAGSRSMTLTIPLVTDVVAENTELFLVELQPIEGGVDIGEHGHAAVIIVDDD